MLAIGFCWCYLTGEWQHDRKKAIKIKKHGRLSISLFRYGLDYVQMVILRLIGFGKKEEFKKVLAILRKKKPDRTGPMKFVVYRAKYYKLTVAFNII